MITKLAEALNRLSGEDDRRYSFVITDTNLDAPGPTILYVGGDYEKLTGYKPEEMIGKSPRVLQGPDSNREVLRNLRETCQRGEYFEGTTINYRKDKTPFMMHWAISPIYVDGKIAFYFAVQCDATVQYPEPIAAVIKKRIASVCATLDKTAANLTQSAGQIGLLLGKAAAEQDDKVCTPDLTKPPPQPTQKS